MADWHDSTKFWAETVRTVSLAIVGAIAAIVILKPAESTVEYAAELDRTKLIIRAKTVEDFLAASHQYTVVAYDACRGIGGEMAKLKGPAEDAYQSALRRIELFFDRSSELEPFIKRIKRLSIELLQSCVGEEGKEKWEPKREELEKENDNLAIAALKILRLFTPEAKR